MTLNDVDATNDNAMFNWLYEEGQTSVARAVLGAGMMTNSGNSFEISILG